MLDWEIQPFEDVTQVTWVKKHQGQEIKSGADKPEGYLIYDRTLKIPGGESRVWVPRKAA